MKAEHLFVHRASGDILTSKRDIAELKRSVPSGLKVLVLCARPEVRDEACRVAGEFPEAVFQPVTQCDLLAEIKRIREKSPVVIFVN